MPTSDASLLSVNKHRGRPAVFLDRDGTLIEDVGYLRRPDDFRPLPGIERALGMLRNKGYALLIVSNQSGVARGLLTWERALELQTMTIGHFSRAGIAFLGSAICPHHPAGTRMSFSHVCACRKPEAGMLQALALKYSLDLARSYMVGDKLSDAQAGKRAGARGILVRTGLTLPHEAHKHFPVYDSLGDFAVESADM